MNIGQKRTVNEQFGLDWEWVRDAVRVTYNDTEQRNELKDGNNVFRVLAKTLIFVGTITYPHKVRVCGMGQHEVVGLGRGRHSGCLRRH